MTKKQSDPTDKAPAAPERGKAESPKFFEIVNWKKAQSMDKPDAPWMKVYTSILNNDKIDSLDDESYRLITNIWALAARLGKHILPANTKWLIKHIPYLKDRKEPDLRPLFETKDMYGRPDPFLRLCEAPGTDSSDADKTGPPAAGSGADGGDSKAAGKKRTKQKAAAENDPFYEKAVALISSCAYASARAISEALNIKYDRARGIVKSMAEAGLVGEYVHRKGRKVLRFARADREEESRVEPEQESETKTKDDPQPLRASDHPLEENKSLSGFNKEQPEQSTADQSIAEKTNTTADQNTAEPENPSNPTNSDAGQAKGSGPHHVPRPVRSVTRGPESIGSILRPRFEPWWRDPDCEAFGWEIAEALGYSTDRDNDQSRNQWGNFAAWLWRVKQAVPSVVVEGLRGKAVEKANEIRTKRRRHIRNPGAAWTFIMGRELESHGVRLPDERAGPAAASV